MGAMYHRICPQCGLAFDTPYSFKKFCSPKCKGQHFKDGENGKRVRTCKWCGKDFWTASEGRIYCSDDCRRKAYEERRAHVKQEEPPKPQRKKKVDAHEELARLSKKARAAGMTYGQYMAKYHGL